MTLGAWWTMKFSPLVFVPCSYFSWESFVSGQTLFSSYIAFNHCEDLSKLFERLQICLFLHSWTCWKVVFVNGLCIWIITSIYWKCFFFFSHKMIFTNDLDKPEKGIYNTGEEFRAHVYIDSTPALPKIYYNLFFLHFTTCEPSFFFSKHDSRGDSK